MPPNQIRKEKTMDRKENLTKEIKAAFNGELIAEYSEPMIGGEWRSFNDPSYDEELAEEFLERRIKSGQKQILKKEEEFRDFILNDDDIIDALVEYAKEICEEIADEQDYRA